MVGYICPNQNELNTMTDSNIDHYTYLKLQKLFQKSKPALNVIKNIRFAYQEA